MFWYVCLTFDEQKIKQKYKNRYLEKFITEESEFWIKSSWQRCLSLLYKFLFILCKRQYAHFAQLLSQWNGENSRNVVKIPLCWPKRRKNICTISVLKFVLFLAINFNNINNISAGEKGKQKSLRIRERWPKTPIVKRNRY